ncbi:quinone-interacting membrane-bound oxidoreductase complex subunit QmoC [Desulfonatronum thiodismutans]|uniref:quinone-interacting membrane-bound oxidoreductase complex subunit QmoC n=1 Tax=Desulfonatronum thiodismutans TaxID=159290 RepID=UPI0004ABE117|nr:quinone-interacting membrane-bound oxidoreductase complex subunit QmoC [Desulfonatronum thiodismutans]
MAQVKRIEPDLQFIQEMQAAGGESLKKCYQCATCSVVCPLSPEENPYPRKEMVWAQWGLKDKLVGDLDMWLCHNCGTCSDQCPRGAKPADLMAAMRNMAYQNIAQPTIMGKFMSSAKYLPILAGIPAVIFLIAWFVTSGFFGTPVDDNGQVLYRLVFPQTAFIDPLFGLIAVAVLVIFARGVLSLIKTFNDSPQAPMGGVPVMTVLKSTWQVIIDEILSHTKWKECGGDNTDRYYGHMGIFFGFVGLFIVTAYVGVAYWLGVFTGLDLMTPMSLWNPFKILANIASIALIVGLVMVTKRRLNLDDAKFKSNYYDWYLLGVIWVVALSGMFSQLLRLANVPGAAYPMYYIHLVSIFMLFAYLPWSKLAHLVYRTVALGYARHIGRSPKPQA